MLTQAGLGQSVVGYPCDACPVRDADTTVASDVMGRELKRFGGGVGRVTWSCQR